jgi:hypothetical protein
MRPAYAEAFARWSLALTAERIHFCFAIAKPEIFFCVRAESRGFWACFADVPAWNTRIMAKK